MTFGGKDPLTLPRDTCSGGLPNIIFLLMSVLSFSLLAVDNILHAISEERSLWFVTTSFSCRNGEVVPLLTCKSAMYLLYSFSFLRFDSSFLP